MKDNTNHKNSKIIVMGGGIAGLTSAYFLRQNGFNPIIIEAQGIPGGLCKSFEIDGYWFDHGGHASFTQNKKIREILEDGVITETKVSQAVNYNKGRWIKNPAQINIAVLSTDEKIKIITDMIRRKDNGNYENYEEWLIAKYGDYFARNFPCKYTRKYWTIDARDMGVDWIGPRMYVPELEEVLFGAFEKETASVHYSGELRYPEKGGFSRFIEKFIKEESIRCNSTVTKINTKEKYIIINNEQRIDYDYLVSTLPLNKMGALVEEASQEVIRACDGLYHTTLILVSLGLNKDVDFQDAFYVYDEEYITVRGYSTSKFGSKNAPDGCSTLQLEVYVSPFKKQNLDLREIKEKVINECVEMGIIKRDNIEVSDVRKIEYANVIFEKDIYSNRKIVHSFLNQERIYYAGRFAHWDYMWVDQVIESALVMTDKLIKDIKGNKEHV